MTVFAMSTIIDGDDEIVDTGDSAIMTEQGDEVIVFVDGPKSNQITIEFNLDLVSVYQKPDGDIVVTLK